MNKNSTTNQWHLASIFFEKHYLLDIETLKTIDEFNAMDQEIQNKVLKLFANKGKGPSILEVPVVDTYSTMLQQDLTGEIIGSYQLIELIAQGGMSLVYRARKTDIESQKDVAIKLIPTNLQTTETSVLFKQELNTLAKLHHPNIISMHHGDVSDSGIPYLVMELVQKAAPIDQYFRQQQTSLKNIVNHIIKLCQVMTYAHQNNIIHQDIKPSNIVVDQHDHLLVLDFGVSALAQMVPKHHAYTLSYATPEQINKSHTPNASFDTYAITSLLIKCLSMVNDQGTGWQQNAIEKIPANPELKLILKKGIDTDPAFRYQSSEELAQDLNLWQHNQPISILKNKPFYRLKKTIYRHPATAILTVLTIGTALTGLIFFQQQYKIATSESLKAQQVKNILIDAISQNDPDISKGQDITVRDLLQNVEIGNSETPINDEETAKELYLTLAMAFNRIGDYESTNSNIQKVLDIEPNNPIALLEMATLYVDQKQSKQADKLLNSLNQVYHTLNPSQQVTQKLLLAQNQITQNDFISAEKNFNLAEQLAQTTNNSQTFITTMAAHANGLLEQDKMDRAIEKINDAVTLSEQQLGIDHSQTLSLKSKLAEIYLSTSGEKVTEAVKIFQATIPQQKALLGNNHPTVAKSLFLIATGLRSLNQISEARNYAEEALSIAKIQFGDRHIFTGKVLMNLGGIHAAENNLEQAIKYAVMAVENHENHFGIEHPETLQYKTSYVAMLAKNQQHEKALKILQQIHPIQTARLGASHRGTLYVDIVMSKTLAALGQLDKSIEAGERCLNNAKNVTTKNIMEIYCAQTLENAYFINQQYTAAADLINQYQNDPLITNQPVAKNQFDEHQKFIDQMSKNQRQKKPNH